jgi:hypothetical protein
MLKGMKRKRICVPVCLVCDVSESIKFSFSRCWLGVCDNVRSMFKGLASLYRLCLGRLCSLT